MSDLAKDKTFLILTTYTATPLPSRSGHEFSRRFGVGVSLYMKMLRLLTLTYTVMGFLQLPLLVSYISGDSNVDAADEASGGLEFMSLANVP